VRENPAVGGARRARGLVRLHRAGSRSGAISW